MCSKIIVSLITITSFPHTQQAETDVFDYDLDPEIHTDDYKTDTVKKPALYKETTKGKFVFYSLIIFVSRTSK
jgi:hypothetical protein